jgi:hypothetical protein
MGEPTLSLKFKLRIDLFLQGCAKLKVSSRYFLELGGALKGLQHLPALIALVHV